MKMNLSALLAASILMTGCIVTEDDIPHAQKVIAAHFFSKQLNEKYPVDEIMVTVEGKYQHIRALNNDAYEEVHKECNHLLVLAKGDFERSELRFDSYIPKKNSKIVKKPFLDCTMRKVSTQNLDGENLEYLVKSEEYINLKSMPKYELKLAEIKRDGKITVLETLTIFQMIADSKAAVAKKKYQENLENL